MISDISNQFRHVASSMSSTRLDVSKLAVRPTTLLKWLSGAAASYALYKTLEIYLRKRKYRDIPGLDTSG